MCVHIMLNQEYKIPEWNDGLYNKEKIIFSGDAAEHVMPLSFEGIYYANKSGSFAAEAVLKEDVGICRTIWKSNFFRYSRCYQE